MIRRDVRSERLDEGMFVGQMRLARVLVVGLVSTPAVAVAACVGEDPAVVVVSPDPLSDSGLDAGSAPADGAPTEDASDAAPDTWCAHRSPKPVFCADFDDAPAVGSGWDNDDVLTTGDGIAAFEPAVSVSPPNAATLAFPAIADAGAQQRIARAELIKTLPATTESRALVEFHATFPSAKPGPGGTVKYVLVKRGERGFSLLRNETQWYALAFNGGAAKGPMALVKDPPEDRWTWAKIVIDYATGFVRLSFDGIDALAGTFEDELKVVDANPTYKLDLGPRHEAGPLPTLKLSIDNVTFNLENQ
jgi:hypothetical protein